MPDLRPCPFCGSNDVEEENAYHHIHIGCNNCGAMGPPLSSTGKDGSWDDAWNNRAELEEAVKTSHNTPMQADAQTCQDIVEDLMCFMDSMEGYTDTVDRQHIRDQFLRVVAGKLLHG